MKADSFWLMSASTDCQQFFVLHISQSMGCIVTFFNVLVGVIVKKANDMVIASS